MEIRPATITDAEAMTRIRRQDGVRESVLGLSSERVNAVEDFLRSLGERDRCFVAAENGEAVGFAVMLVNKEECRAHSAFIAVMVDSDFQQRGIGERLLARVVDCADNEFALHRLELLVLTDNARAIKLYRRHGFEVEATKHNAAVVRGRFADEYLMGRLRGEEAAR